MLLVIDVGNTNTVLGLFDQDQLLHDWRIRTEIDHTIDEYGVLIYNLYQSIRMKAKEIKSVRSIIISCVVPPMLNILEPLCIKYFNIKPMIVGPGIKTGMPIFYDNPKEVGADRIVNAVAAFEKYRQETIIVDFGTATTFDYVSPRGEYRRLHFAGDRDLQRGALRGLPSCPAPNSATQDHHYQGHRQPFRRHRLRWPGGRHCQPMKAEVKATLRSSPRGAGGGAGSDDDKIEEMLTLDGLRIIYERNKK